MRRLLTSVVAWGWATLSLVTVVAAEPERVFNVSRLAAEPLTDQELAAAARLGGGAGQAMGGDQGADDEEVEIRDNSFLVEEAYNQEQGVVQHIFNWVPSWERTVRNQDRFDFVFTQEWPIFSQKHQFSYTLPMSYVSDSTTGTEFNSRGFGDMFLNYRYQLLGGEGDAVACSPRFSVILPTGDVNQGLGNGVTGYQVDLPLSQYGKCWGWVFNAGTTWLPDVRAGLDPTLSTTARTLHGYNLGGSLIRLVKPNFNVMLETVALWNDELQPDSSVVNRFQYILSPSFRWAPYTEGSTQWVVGAAVPIGLSADAPDVSAFLYMSFEHRVAKERK